MDKNVLRSLALKKRSTLKNEELNEKSRKIVKRLEDLDIFKNAKVVLAYFSHDSEVKTRHLIEKWQHQKQFLLPRLIEGNTFVAMPFGSLDTLEKNRFGIPEPAFYEGDPPKPDLIIVPGVAFDRRGNRIGMGKGYYDRFLADKENIPKIALAYSEQILDSVAHEPYDKPVDYIITEDETIRC